MLHELKPNDKPRHRTFAKEMLQKMEGDWNFSTTCNCLQMRQHFIYRAKQYNTWIWGLANPHAILQQARNSLKVNVVWNTAWLNNRAFFFCCLFLGNCLLWQLPWYAWSFCISSNGGLAPKYHFPAEWCTTTLEVWKCKKF